MKTQPKSGQFQQRCNKFKLSNLAANFVDIKCGFELGEVWENILIFSLKHFFP